MLRAIFSCYLLLLSLQSIDGQTLLTTQGHVIVNEAGDTILLRGMGLGGWMLQEGYMLQTAGFANAQHKIKETITDLIGEEATDRFYDAWLENHVRKADIDSLKSWGFNSVRLPMHYNLFTLPIEEEPTPGEDTWIDRGFVMTDSLLSWCKQNDMYVVLDLHAAPGGQGKDEGISDYDPSKPSLWQSPENKRKTVALWKKLAERYVDEDYIAGYDLLNEVNWELPGNTALKNLYLDITSAIREVDNRHILFIEGNWFANDFTGLTPPWDDNMVYSPHKYWSYNDQPTIQWVLDIREAFNVPLYFGEWGENSNPWFRDAIKLFEDYDIGWAVWPMKKIESIAGPLSVIKTDDYQSLLDYWNNGGSKPSAAFAEATLMEITEGLKIENCIYQRDVIDAMFRLQSSEEAMPYREISIPGKIHAIDYDMGPVGVAYSDVGIADYRVSTGNFTAWNNGWSYRNDGVDIEITQDIENVKGYNVGWMDEGEWLQYTPSNIDPGAYDVKVRIASNTNDGAFRLQVDRADITPSVPVQNTLGWQTWEDVTVRGVTIDESDKTIQFYVDQSGFNLSSIEWIRKGATTDISTDYISSETIDEYSIRVSINKGLMASTIDKDQFTITVNGASIPIDKVEVSENSARNLIFSISRKLRSEHDILISYDGAKVLSTDNLPLQKFTNQPVKNTIAIIHTIPGRVEAEDYYFQQGIQVENTSDNGGGQNIGYLDVGDYLDYFIDVSTGGTYGVTFRTASESATGQVELQLIDSDQNASVLATISFPSTGGWQTWTSSTTQVKLPQGLQQIRMVITKPLFNINYLDFDLITSVKNEPGLGTTKLYPNPAIDHVHLEIDPVLFPSISSIDLMDAQGKWLRRYKTTTNPQIINVKELSSGTYLLKLNIEKSRSSIIKFIK